MHSDIAPFSSIDALEVQLRASSDRAEISRALRALQSQQLTEADLRVHIERLRAQNLGAKRSETLEENCLLALDMIHGYGPGALDWSAGTLARLYLSAFIEPTSLIEQFERAAVPNDLLPRRPYEGLLSEASTALQEPLLSFLSTWNFSITPAHVFRAPKMAYTTRPAALLTLADRLLYEALAGMIEERVNELLPEGVLWPRGSLGPSAGSVVEKWRSHPLEWQSEYLVKADVSAFYSSISHKQLSESLSQNLGMPHYYCSAVEAYLSTLMRLDRGLPQGLETSDVFASAAILPVDLMLEEHDVQYVRYGDDYWFPAQSLAEARRILQSLESALGRWGFTLNDEKTMVMRPSDFQDGLDALPHRIEEERHRIRDAKMTEIQESEDLNWVVQRLEDLGVEADELSKLFYRGRKKLDQILETISGKLAPTDAETNATLLKGLVERLKEEPPVGTYARAMEHLSREHLLVLTAARYPLDCDNIYLLLQWLPILAPDVARYLDAISSKASGEVRQLLMDTIDRDELGDWVSSWLVSGVDWTQLAPFDDQIRTLELTAMDTKRGILSRMASVRALASLRSLEERVWQQVFSDASDAVKLEMVMSLLAEAELYPWIERSPSEHQIDTAFNALEDPSLR